MLLVRLSRKTRKQSNQFPVNQASGDETHQTMLRFELKRLFQCLTRHFDRSRSWRNRRNGLSRDRHRRSYCGRYYRSRRFQSLAPSHITPPDPDLKLIIQDGVAPAGQRRNRIRSSRGDDKGAREGLEAVEFNCSGLLDHINSKKSSNSPSINSPWTVKNTTCSVVSPTGIDGIQASKIKRLESCCGCRVAGSWEKAATICCGDFAKRASRLAGEKRDQFGVQTNPPSSYNPPPLTRS